MYLGEIFDAIKLAAVLLAGTALLLSLIMFAVIPLGKLSCHSRWQASGMESDYGVMKGCVVKTLDGRWVPEDVYREIRP